MDGISVRAVDGTTFEVRVEGASTTTHYVVLSQYYYQSLSNGRVSPEILIEASFRFLLERESNTSILPRFDLPLISRYFPEYEKTIKKVLD
ncbi:MAG: hypothetical protein ACE5FZ_04815 [Nitrospiria bacterium]